MYQGPGGFGHSQGIEAMAQKHRHRDTHTDMVTYRLIDDPVKIQRPPGKETEMLVHSAVRPRNSETKKRIYEKDKATFYMKKPDTDME